MNLDMVIVIAKILGFITFIGSVLFYIVKFLIARHQKHKEQVILLLSEFDKTIVTFTSGSYKWEQPLTRLFESCSIKSYNNRINGIGIIPCESDFIRNGILVNIQNSIPITVFNGAVGISISNASKVNEYIKLGSLPTKIKSINLEPLLQSHHIHIDCKQRSLNDLILQYKELFITYDKKLVQQFKWLQWQPYI